MSLPAIGERGVDIAPDALQISRQHLADILLEHVERGPAVELVEHVVLGLGHVVHRADRRAALAEPGRHADIAVEQDARQPAFDDVATRHLAEGAARGGQPADQEALGVVAQRIDDRRQILVARIAVHHAEHRAPLVRPRAEIVGQRLAGPRDDRQDAVAVRRDGGREHGHGGGVEILLAGDADAEADGADPVRDAGRLLEPRQDRVERIGEQIGHIDEAQRRVRAAAELLDAALDDAFPVAAAGMRGAKTLVADRHGPLPVTAAPA